MSEKTVAIAKGEEACKLFDCIIAYRKSIGAVEPEFSEEAETFTIGALSTPEAEVTMPKPKAL